LQQQERSPNSDRFSEGLVQLGNVADHAELDAGKVANNQLFWKGVQESFKSQDEIYENLYFADEEVLSELHHINFWKIVPLLDWSYKPHSKILQLLKTFKRIDATINFSFYFRDHKSQY